jgi:glutamate decarboxylase
VFALMLLQGIDADRAYQIIQNELSLDGQPLLNLASFVSTWMPTQCDRLMAENISNNLIEYPMTQDIHTRCLSYIFAPYDNQFTRLRRHLHLG